MLGHLRGILLWLSAIVVELLTLVGQYKAATALVRRLYTKSNAEKADMLAHLATIEEHTNLEGARDLLEEATLSAPSVGEHHWQLACVYEKLGNTGHCLKELRLASQYGENFSPEFKVRLAKEIDRLALTTRDQAPPIEP